MPAENMDIRAGADFELSTVRVSEGEVEQGEAVVPGGFGEGPAEVVEDALGRAPMKTKSEFWPADTTRAQQVRSSASKPG